MDSFTLKGYSDTITELDLIFKDKLVVLNRGPNNIIEYRVKRSKGLIIISLSNKVDTKLLIDLVKAVKAVSITNNKAALLSSDINIAITLVLETSSKAIKLVLDFNGEVEPALNAIELAR